MKLILAGIVAAGLFAGLFLLPVSGHTLWQRAQARGLPQSAARAMSHGAHAAVRWAEEKQAHSSGAAASGPAVRKPIHKEVARAAPSSAQNAYSQAHYKNVPAAPEAVARDSGAGELAVPQPARAANSAPSRAHDHIVAAPPQETLSSGDRAGLDQLIARQASR